jgi:endonuclease/exonuclease/phosphatase (EEP) superfamily protein YafD
MLKPQTPLVKLFIKRFVPLYRFISLPAITFERSYGLQTALDCSSIKILNWNIAKKNHEKIWARDFLAILEQYKPDIVCLQEVRMGMVEKHIVGLAEMGWNFAPNFRDAHHNTYAGILTAARTRSIATRAIITEHHEPVLKTPKVSLITEYPISNRQETLLTINSHLINFVALTKFSAQLHQLEAILSEHQGPIVFSGDFNTWSRSRRIFLEKVVTRLGLIPASFTTRDSQKIKRFLLSPPLDYIFYRGLDENRAKARVLDNISSSDHKPMLVEFSYFCSSSF